ncbi:SDR family oxidoreductase [Microlunatus soli]|uniref:Short-chain dehydrogenase n=1 Tax=Microlunatus soli TaxID=630515 RepID=A0A1H1N4J3_9ACTN|nr:SDR family oxidoreductase [Microlunatus soli]SDR93837.1 Short-chain dehydrogenase [Microlunatus soli]
MAKTKDANVAVVTGGTGGIGRATVRRLAAAGYDVAVLARGQVGLDGAVADVRAQGRRAIGIVVDVVDHQAVAAAADRAETALGPIDCWVNAAFTSVFARFVDIEPAEYRRVTEVNYLGFVHGTRAALDKMLPRDHGTIVQVGSALAYRGIPLQSAYCGSKHAIQGFHEALRCELLHEHSNVHVTMVQMPGMNTPQFDWVLSRLPKRAQPVPPIYQPEIAADAVLHAVRHPRRREYWVGGSTVGTMIGDKFAPWLLDRYLARTGFAAQQSDADQPPGQANNLWEPLDGPDGFDRGPHGRFDDRAKSRSYQSWASEHHASIAVGTAGVVAGGVLLLTRRLTRGAAR